MSVSGKKGVGIPIILLHDAEGGIVTIELKNGESYRGILDESQDTMNCTMKDCVKTDTKGKETRIAAAYIRGSQISFIAVPDMLKKAPFFNRIHLWRKFKGHAVMGGGQVISKSGMITMRGQEPEGGKGKGGKGFKGGGRGFGGKGSFSGRGGGGYDGGKGGKGGFDGGKGGGGGYYGGGKGGGGYGGGYR